MVMPVRKADALPWEAGTINLHGKTITVISVRALFNEEIPNARLTDMLIIARADSRDLALWVDVTSGVHEIPLLPEATEDKQEVPPPVPGVQITADGIQVIYDLSRLIDAKSRISTETRLLHQPSSSDITTCRSGEHGEEDGSADTTHINAVLTERAKKIARPEEGLSDITMVEVLRFRLAYREYAIEMDHIREVILTGEITPVPGTPEYISGICVVRGEIISLVDLRVLLAIPEKGLTDLNRVIVLTDHKLSFGILADHITGIGTIELNRIAPPDTGTIGGGRNDYVKGIAGGSLIVLDTTALFADPKMIIEDR